MGDGGAYFLGFMSGVIGLLTFSELDNSAQVLINTKNLLLLFLILFIPIFDMTMVILRRIRRGNHPFILIELICIIIYMTKD